MAHSFHKDLKEKYLLKEIYLPSNEKFIKSAESKWAITICN